MADFGPYRRAVLYGPDGKRLGTSTDNPDASVLLAQLSGRNVPQASLLAVLLHAQAINIPASSLYSSLSYDNTGYASMANVAAVVSGTSPDWYISLIGSDIAGINGPVWQSPNQTGTGYSTPLANGAFPTSPGTSTNVSNISATNALTLIDLLTRVEA